MHQRAAVEDFAAIYALYAKDRFGALAGLALSEGLVRRFLVICVPRNINRGEIFQCPIAQGTDRLSE